MTLVLASESPYRKQQLHQLGLRFVAVAPSVDEDALKKKGPSDLVELCSYLAREKSASVRTRFPDAVIIGADQMLECDGLRFDKPGSRESAVQQLQKLAGRSHRLLTSICVASPLRKLEHMDKTTIELRTLSLAEIHAYLDIDKAWNCAGSYMFERAGIALVRKIATQDSSAVQGLPIIALIDALKELGISLQQLWSDK